MGGKSTTSTQSVSIPPEVMARYNAVNARAEEVAKTPFQQYGGQFVAPTTPTQQAGIQATNAASTAAQPYYGAATGLTLSGAQDVGPLTQGQIGYYQNPYTEAVVSPTLQALQQQQGQERSMQQAQAIKSGAFGGDRAGLQRAELARQQTLGTAQAIAPLYQQGYGQAVQTAQSQQGVVASDLARRMQAGQAIAGLGTGAQQAALQGAQAQIGAGTLEQQTQQADLTARYQQFLQERGYDFQTAQFLANIAMGTGALSGSTTTTTQPQSLFSDERLKENIKQVGETNDGLPIYTYNYKGEKTTQMGLIAQDVEKKKPEAVGLAGGFKTVDYDKATEGSERRGREYGGGLAPDYNSMGGAVDLGSAGEAFARGGYALSGSVVDPTDMRSILEANKQSLAPFSQAGLYGGAGGQENPMGGKSYVPKASLATPKMISPAPAPRQQQSGLAEAMQGMRQAQGLGETVSSIGSGVKKAAVGAPAVMKDGKVVEKATTGLIGKGGETGGGVFNPKAAEGVAAGVASAAPAKIADAASEGPGFVDRATEFVKGLNPFKADGGPVDPHHRLGYAGLGKVINPMELQDPSEGIGAYIDDASESQGENKLNTPGVGGGGGGKSGGIGSDLLQAGQLAMMGAKAAPMIAEGFTALMAALPFSDQRLKSNIEQVGKTFDGQNIYTYNLGNGPTQMGLIAQEVAKKHPDAVGQRKGYMTVDYDAATDRAADRGHFYSGGVVPLRHGYQDGGNPYEPDPRLIQSESGGRFDAENDAVGAGGKRGHFGRLQFGQARLEDAVRAGVLPEGITPQQFMANPGLQKATEKFHFADISNYIEDKGLKQAIGTEIGGIPVTQQGLQNVAHLGGKEGMRKFVESGGRYDPADANGTRLSDYLRMGSGSEGLGAVGRAAQSVKDTAQQGLGGVERFAKSILPTTRDAKTGEESFNLKQILIPALTGIGAAATTPTRNLGTAIAAGLGAGAQSYANLEKHQADVDRIKMETAEAGARTANLAFQGNMVRLPNGQMVLTVEALKKGLIPAGAELAGAAADSATARYLKSIGLNVSSNGTVSVPSGVGTGVGGEFPKAIAPSVDPAMTERGIFGAASRNLANKDAYLTMGLTPEGAKETSNKYQTSTAAAGLQANNNQQLVNDLALNTSRIVTGTGYDVPGSSANFRAEMAKRINTIVRSIDPSAPDVSSLDKLKANQDKLNIILSSQRTNEAGQHNLGALEIMMGAVANPDMPPETQAKIIAQLMAQNQKARDRDQHREVFGDVSGGSYALAGQAFDRDTRGRYEREQAMLETLVRKYPGAIEKLTSGTKDAKTIESFMQQMAKQNGIRYTPGVSRYFVEQGAQ